MKNNDVSDAAWALLTDGPRPPESAEVFCLESIKGDETTGGWATLRGLWKAHGEDIVRQWAEDHPGTRPSCWWLWQGPEADPDKSGDYRHGVTPPAHEQPEILRLFGALLPGELARVPRRK